MSEESYLDSLLKSMTDEEDISLSDEELNNLDISTVTDVELADIDVSDMDIDDISELFVDDSELEINMSVPEDMDIVLPEIEENEEIDIPLVMEEPEKESDDFMDDVDNLLNILSDDSTSGNQSVKTDEPDSFFSLDGLMAMEEDDIIYDEGASEDELPDLFADEKTLDNNTQAESFEDDLMDFLNDKPNEKQEQPKKAGIIAKLFGNIHDAKSKRAHEKMLSDEEKKALKKKEREEKKAAKKAMKEDPAYIAEQEAKKREKEEKKAQAKALKEAKKREKEELKKQRQAEEEEEALKDQGRINRVGATIVFVCLGAFAASVIFGSNSFSYNQSVAKAEEYFGNREYTEAYNEIRGVDLKNEDIEMYDKIMTVMYVNKQLNSYNNYYAMQMYPEALDSLLKGLEKYDNYQEAAKQLGISSDLDYVRGQIIVELQTIFSLSEQEAYSIIELGTQQEYSQEVIEAAQDPK